MKLYFSLFLAASSLPLGFLAAFAAMKPGFGLSLPSILSNIAVVTSVALLLALILFVWSIPATRKRLKEAPANQQL